MVANLPYFRNLKAVEISLREQYVQDRFTMQGAEITSDVLRSFVSSRSQFGMFKRLAPHYAEDFYASLDPYAVTQAFTLPNVASELDISDFLSDVCSGDDADTRKLRDIRQFVNNDVLFAAYAAREIISDPVAEALNRFRHKEYASLRSRLPRSGSRRNTRLGLSRRF